MAMNALETIAQELRAYARDHPWDLADAIRTQRRPPAGCRRDLTLEKRAVRLQFTFSHPIPGSGVHRPLWHFSVSPRDDLGPLPPDLVEALVRALFPDERPIEAKGPVFPGLVRHFSLYGSPLIEPPRHDGQDGD